MANAQSVFSTFFTEKTMRIDYVHTGGGQELFSLDQVVSDGLWAGSRTRLLDDTNLGHVPLRGDRPRARTGRSTRAGSRRLYGEWETTAEPKQGIHRSFHESLRFPWPKAPVQVVVKKRDAGNAVPRGLVDDRSIPPRAS
ncbi:MAG: hypothetical protein MZU79_00685 [Anaerotruncus sp.]|nr:hypothetical protein [Anaerotruncus sp.]